LPAPLQLSPISQGHGTMWYYMILYVNSVQSMFHCHSVCWW
jgi:hypothetical protein